MPPTADPVFGAFVEAGLWPGLGRTLGGELAAAGIIRPADVTVDKLAELPRVGRVRADRLVRQFRGAVESYEVVALLVPAGLPAGLARGAATALGPGAATALLLDPWRLLELSDAQPADADRLAASVRDGAWQPGDALRRGRAILTHLLAAAARDGHTAAPVQEIAARLRAFRVPDPDAVLRSAADAGTVRLDDNRDATDTARTDDTADAPPPLVALERYAVAEAALAAGLARLLAAARPLADPAALNPVTKGLDEAQRAAVATAIERGVSVLTGGPGTGKSRTVAALAEFARVRRKKLELAAPTGRAAKRLEELVGAPAATLHRLLGAQGSTGEFARGEHYPLDADLVVVDEVSMLDAELAAALVAACRAGTHLLLVGDPAQLPSIGPGRVLGDLLDSGVVPVTELRTLYRQAEGGAIARLATAVRAGELPAEPASPDREVVLVPSANAAEAAHRVRQLVVDSIPRALGIAADDIQVVTPVHRGAAGTQALNAALKAALNPGPGAHRGFDPGDRVVATANHLDVGFANGEVGVVVGPAPTKGDAGGLVVQFSTGPVTVPPAVLGDLVHGFAITVHRAQGSEWPAVVAVLPPESGRLLSRPLVYTAFTRARRHLSVVPACGPALARAVARVGERPRVTRLAALLRAAAGSSHSPHTPPRERSEPAETGDSRHWLTDTLLADG